MYIKNDDANTKALVELEKLIDADLPENSLINARIQQLSKAIARYERKYDEGYQPVYTWQIKHPEAAYKAPEHHPDDTNHVRHKLRQLYRQADREQALAKRKETNAKSSII